MKNLFFFLLISTQTFAQEVPQATLDRLQKLYPDQSLEFIKERIKNAPTPFNKWRSFPPYYYELINRSVSSRELKNRKGMCAGDPHLENFGFIANGDSPIFTINDLDDVTSCSLNADLMRLYIGQRLISPNLKADAFLAQYNSGLNGANCARPEYIHKLAKDAIKKGQGLSKKNKAMLEAKTCTGDYQVLTDAEKNMLDAFVKAENGDQSCLKSDVLSPDLRKLAKSVVNQDPKEIMHACSRIKESGGSAGGKRFLVFRKSSAGVVDAFELKPLVKSAPDYEGSFSQSTRAIQFKKAVETYFSPELKSHYYPVVLNKVLYQRRPVWSGNEEIKADDMDAAQTEAVMMYETCVLGSLHARSKPAAFTAHPGEWEKQALEIEVQFKKEFGH